MTKGTERNAHKRRKQAAASLRQRAGKNLVFGTVAAILGAVLTVWSRQHGGEIGISVTQMIYWGLIAGGALELAVGVWQLYQAREVLEGRIEVAPETARSEESEELTGPLTVRFQPPRGKHLGWFVFASLIGALFFFGFGTPGAALGSAFWAYGGYQLYQWVRSLASTPQEIRLTASTIELPSSPYATSRAEHSLTDVRHAYMLRRSVPLFYAPPVLVVDLGDQTRMYPRDWFESEQQQERVASALRSRITSS